MLARRARVGAEAKASCGGKGGPWGSRRGVARAPSGALSVLSGRCRWPVECRRSAVEVLSKPVEAGGLGAGGQGWGLGKSLQFSGVQKRCASSDSPPTTSTRPRRARGSTGARPRPRTPRRTCLCRRARASTAWRRRPCSLRADDARPTFSLLRCRAVFSLLEALDWTTLRRPFPALSAGRAGPARAGPLRRPRGSSSGASICRSQPRIHQRALGYAQGRWRDVVGFRFRFSRRARRALLNLS